MATLRLASCPGVQAIAQAPPRPCGCRGYRARQGREGGRVRFSVASNVGLVRERNEDAFCVWEIPGFSNHVLLAVADGMGGHQAGEVASTLALETIRSHVRRAMRAGGQSAPGPEALGRLLREGIRVANRRIYWRARRRPELAGMGTTVTALLVAGNTLCLGHVGDSRAYLVRDGGIRLLTDDHSLVAEMLKKGDLTEEEAMLHPHRHVLTRALGVERDIEVDLTVWPLAPGDILVLATDGLTNLLSPDEIVQTITNYSGDFHGVAGRLVNMANARGGYDNSTVIVTEI